MKECEFARDVIDRVENYIVAGHGRVPRPKVDETEPTCVILPEPKAIDVYCAPTQPVIVFNRNFNEDIMTAVTNMGFTGGHNIPRVVILAGAVAEVDKAKVPNEAKVISWVTDQIQVSTLFFGHTESATFSDDLQKIQPFDGSDWDFTWACEMLQSLPISRNMPIVIDNDATEG
eukprot:Nk52_evm1s931 gene=Nk52_evmTU1s931